MTNFFMELMKFFLNLSSRVIEVAVLTAVTVYVTRFVERQFSYGQA